MSWVLSVRKACTFPCDGVGSLLPKAAGIPLGDAVRTRGTASGSDQLLKIMAALSR